MGIAERAVRRVKEGTSAVLRQSGLNENWWANSMECYPLFPQSSRERKHNYFTRLTQNNDIVCFQETHGKDEFLQAFQVLMPNNVNAGGSAICINKDLLPEGTFATHVVTRQGRDHIVNIRTGGRNFVVGNVHFEPDLTLRSLRERLRLVTPHWPLYSEVVWLRTSMFANPRKEGSMFGIRPSLRVIQERLPFSMIFPRVLEIAQPGFTRRDSTADGTIHTLPRTDRAFINLPMAEARDDHCQSHVLESWTTVHTNWPCSGALLSHRNRLFGVTRADAFRVGCPKIPSSAQFWSRSMNTNTHRSLIWWEDPYERRFGQPFKGPIIRFGSLVEYHPISAKDQSRIHQFGKKVLPGLFLGYALYAGWIWKGDVLVADLEGLETMDVSEIYSKRLTTKEVIFPQEKGEFIFPIADGRVKPFGRDQDLRTSTSIRHRPIQGESHIDFLGESEGSPPPPPQDSFPDDPVVTVLPVQNKIIPRDPEEPNVVLGADAEKPKSFILTIPSCMVWLEKVLSAVKLKGRRTQLFLFRGVDRRKIKCHVLWYHVMSDEDCVKSQVWRHMVRQQVLETGVDLVECCRNHIAIDGRWKECLEEKRRVEQWCSSGVGSAEDEFWGFTALSRSSGPSTIQTDNLGIRDVKMWELLMNCANRIGTWMWSTFYCIALKRKGGPFLNHLLQRHGGHQGSGRSTEHKQAFSQAVSLTGNGDSPVSDGGCKQYIAPRKQSHAQMFLARGSSSHCSCSVLCVRCFQNIHSLARMSCSGRCLTRHYWLHENWALLLHVLYCSLRTGLPLPSTPPTGLLFARFAEQSPLTVCGTVQQKWWCFISEKADILFFCDQQVRWTEDSWKVRKVESYRFTARVTCRMQSCSAQSFPSTVLSVCAATSDWCEECGQRITDQSFSSTEKKRREDEWAVGFSTCRFFDEAVCDQRSCTGKLVAKS